MDGDDEQNLWRLHGGADFARSLACDDGQVSGADGIDDVGGGSGADDVAGGANDDDVYGGQSGVFGDSLDGERAMTTLPISNAVIPSFWLAATERT
jgi:hypothetical protein